MLFRSLGQVPGMFLYAYLGRFAQSTLRAWRGEGALTPGDWALWIGGLVSMLIVTGIFARIALRILAEAGAADVKEERP